MGELKTKMPVEVAEKVLEQTMQNNSCLSYWINGKAYKVDDAIETILAVHTKRENAIKSLGHDIRTFRESIGNEAVLIGFNSCVALCNKWIGKDKI